MNPALEWAPQALLRFGVAAALALYFTPILRSAALAHDIVDRPDGRLKRQERPIAYLGGLAIFLSFLLTLGLTLERFEPRVQGLLLGASIVLLLGLVDDMKAISPTVKFLGQLLAAWVLLKSGIRIEIAFLNQPYPILCDLLTVLWIVGVTNAFNIIDVLDGLSAGVAAVALLFLCAVAVLNGSYQSALFPVTLAGATFGFLRFNFRPASIYLGDAGSMLLGFLAASLAMVLSYADKNPIAVTAPLLILGVPLFDTALVIALRARRGLPVFHGSPDHYAVRLRRAGVPVAVIAAGSYAVSLVLGGCAIWLMYLGRRGSWVLLGSLLVAAVAAGAVIARVGAQGPEKSAPSDGGEPSPLRAVEGSSRPRS